MAAGSIVIDLLMRTGSFETDTDRAARSMRKFERQAVASATATRTALTGMLAGLSGAFVVGQLGSFLKATTDGIDRISDLADAAGSTAKKIDALERLARGTGSPVEVASDAVLKLNQALQAGDDSRIGQVLRSIGLSAEELRRIDPADALRRVAEGFAQYADNGDRARAIAVVFGKSSRELASYLKELAQAGELNSSVTNRLTEDSERFNKQLGALQNNAVDAGRAIADKLLPPLNDAVEAFRKSWERGTLLLDVLGGIAGFNLAAAALPGIPKSSELERLNQLRIGLENVRDADAAAGRAENERNTRRLAFINAQIAALQRLESLRTPFTPGLGVNPAGLVGRPKITPPGEPSSAKQPELADLAVLYGYDQLEQMRMSLPDLGDVERFASTVAKATDAGADAILLGYDQIEQMRLSVPRALEDVADAIGRTTSRLDDFTKNAAQSFQSVFGQTLVDLFDGTAGSVEKRFLDLVKRLAAEAVAADLTRALFGKAGGGEGKGVFDSLISSVGSFFAGARASGGPVSGGSTYLVGERGPELFTPNTSGRIIPNNALGGGGISVVVNNAPPGTSVRQERGPDGGLRAIIEIAKAEARAEAVADFASGSGPRSAALKARGVNLNGALPRRA